MSVPQGSGKNVQNKATADYKSYLESVSSLSNIYERANNELYRNQSMGVAVVPPKYTDTEQELQDQVFQRERALVNLRKMMHQSDANAVLQNLMQNDKVNLFNRFFKGFEKEIGFQQNITPTVFDNLWNRYEVKLVSTGLTGISVGVEQAEYDDGIDALRNEIQALANDMRDSRDLNSFEFETIKEKSDKLASSRDLNKLQELMSKLTSSDTKEDKEKILAEAKAKREEAEIKKAEKRSKQMKLKSDMKVDLDRLESMDLADLRRLVDDEVTKRGDTNYIDSGDRKMTISASTSPGKKLVEFLLNIKYGERPLMSSYKASDLKVKLSKQKRFELAGEKARADVDKMLKAEDEALKKKYKEEMEQKTRLAETERVRQEAEAKRYQEEIEYYEKLAREDEAKRIKQEKLEKAQRTQVPLKSAVERELLGKLKKKDDGDLKEGDGFLRWRMANKKKVRKGRGISNDSDNSNATFDPAQNLASEPCIGSERIPKGSNKSSDPPGVGMGPKFIKLGFYRVYMPDLHKGVLSFRFPNSYKLVRPHILISSHLKKIFYQLLLNEPIDEELFTLLDDAEIKVIDDAMSLCRVDPSITNSMTKHLKKITTSRDLAVKRFNVLRGSLLAGNDSPSILKELKLLILDMNRSGYLSQHDCNKTMYEIGMLSH